MTLVMCVALYWWLAPVYGFKAHQGKVPMSPFGWHSLPDAAPYTEQLDDPRYASAAERTKQSLLAHRHRLRSPALSAAVAIDGKLVWAGAAGWSDIASERAATPLTAFRIGSTSKAITATVLARLTERGTVDLDTPIGAYISPLPNDAWHSITLRQLATHQSGLPHYKENTEISGLYRSIALNKHYADVRDALSVFDDSELLFEPGKDFHYSTLGTVLLGATLSHASDVSYRQLVADEILSPLNLNTIAVAPRSAKNRPELATSYFVDGDRFRRWRPVDMTHRLPGGGFVATSSDLAKLGVAWLDNDYLSPATRETFWTPQLMADGEVNAQHYALGFRWSKWQTPDGETYEHANHGGVSRGAQSWLMILPAQRMAVAININRKTEEFGDFAVVYRDILEAFTNP
ncbi:MAG: serine hydrolase domain-containing protein [Pseudomonadota bacterium]